MLLTLEREWIPRPRRGHRYDFYHLSREATHRQRRSAVIQRNRTAGFGLKRTHQVGTEAAPDARLCVHRARLAQRDVFAYNLAGIRVHESRIQRVRPPPRHFMGGKYWDVIHGCLATEWGPAPCSRIFSRTSLPSNSYRSPSNPQFAQPVEGGTMFQDPSTLRPFILRSASSGQAKLSTNGLRVFSGRIEFARCRQSIPRRFSKNSRLYTAEACASSPVAVSSTSQPS